MAIFFGIPTRSYDFLAFKRVRFKPAYRKNKYIYTDFKFNGLAKNFDKQQQNASTPVAYAYAKLPRCY